MSLLMNPCCDCACTIAGRTQAGVTVDDVEEADFTVVRGTATYSAPGGLPGRWTVGADDTLIVFGTTTTGAQALRFEWNVPAVGECLAAVLAYYDGDNYLLAEIEAGVAYRLISVQGGTETVLERTWAVNTGSQTTATLQACWNPATQTLSLGPSLLFGTATGNASLEVIVPDGLTLGNKVGFWFRTTASSKWMHFLELHKPTTTPAGVVGGVSCPKCSESCTRAFGAGYTSAVDINEWVDVISGSFAIASSGGNAWFESSGNGRVIYKKEFATEWLGHIASWGTTGTKRDARLRIIVDYLDDDNFHYVEAEVMNPVSGNPAFPMTWGICSGGTETALVTNAALTWDGGRGSAFITEQMLLRFSGTFPGDNYTGYQGWFTTAHGGVRVGFEILNNNIPFRVSFGSVYQTLERDQYAPLTSPETSGQCVKPKLAWDCAYIPEDLLLTVAGFSASISEVNGAWTCSFDGFGYWLSAMTNFASPIVITYNGGLSTFTATKFQFRAILRDVAANNSTVTLTLYNASNVPLVADTWYRTGALDVDDLTPENATIIDGDCRTMDPQTGFVNSTPNGTFPWAGDSVTAEVEPI